MNFDDKDAVELHHLRNFSFSLFMWWLSLPHIWQAKAQTLPSRHVPNGWQPFIFMKMKKQSNCRFGHKQEKEKKKKDVILFWYLYYWPPLATSFCWIIINACSGFFIFCSWSKLVKLSWHEPLVVHENSEEKTVNIWYSCIALLAISHDCF